MIETTETTANAAARPDVAGQQALYRALAETQAELATIPVPKNCTAKVQLKSGGSYTFRYADLPSILSVILPVAAKHGLCIVQAPSVDDGHVCVRTTMYHVAGGSLQCGAVKAPASGKGVQEMGGLITYFRRYALCAVFGVAADDDDDANACDGNQAGVDRKPSAVEQLRSDLRKRLGALPVEEAKSIVSRCGARTFDGATPGQLREMAKLLGISSE